MKTLFSILGICTVVLVACFCPTMFSLPDPCFREISSSAQALKGWQLRLKVRSDGVIKNPLTVEYISWVFITSYGKTLAVNSWPKVVKYHAPKDLVISGANL